MFCTKCGAKIEMPAKFCPKCGTPVEPEAAPMSSAQSASVPPVQPASIPPAQSAPVPPVQPLPVSPASIPSAQPASIPQTQSVPIPPMPSAASSSGPAVNASPAGAPKSKVRYGANTVLGILGAFLVFVSVFMPFFALSASFGGLSSSESFSYLEFMASVSKDYLEFEAELALGMVTFAGIALTVFFQLIKRPKLSLTGVAGFAGLLAIFLIALRDTGVTQWGVSVVYSIGFFLYIIGMVMALVGALMKKRRMNF